jgi:hypothetical protein
MRHYHTDHALCDWQLKKLRKALLWVQNLSNVTENDNEASRSEGAKTLQEVVCFEALWWDDCKYRGSPQPLVRTACGSTAQILAMSRRLLTAEARFRSRVSIRCMCRIQWDSGTRFSPSTSDFLCQRNFTSKVLHIPVSFICYRRCKTLTIEGILNIAHLSIDQQTKLKSRNTILEHYSYITSLCKLFEENSPQCRAFLSSCPWTRQIYHTKSLLPTGRLVTASVLW